MTAYTQWSQMTPEYRRRVRLAVLDVVRSAPSGQFWTAYGLQRHADLEDVEPAHQTEALLELMDRGVVECTPSTGGWFARPWRVADVVAVWVGGYAYGGEQLRTATVERVRKDGSCTISGSSYRWRADGSCVGREGYHLRRARS